MRKYAQILNGKVHYIFESEVKPQFSKDIHIVDITNNKEVKEGWDYNIYEKTFNESTHEDIKALDPYEKMLARLRIEMIEFLSEMEVI